MGGVKGLMAHGFHFHLHCLDWKGGGGVGGLMAYNPH